MTRPTTQLQLDVDLRVKFKIENTYIGRMCKRDNVDETAIPRNQLLLQSFFMLFMLASYLRGVAVSSTIIHFLLDAVAPRCRCQCWWACLPSRDPARPRPLTLPRPPARQSLQRHLMNKVKILPKFMNPKTTKQILMEHDNNIAYTSD